MKSDHPGQGTAHPAVIARPPITSGAGFDRAIQFSRKWHRGLDAPVEPGHDGSVYGDAPA